MGHTVLSDFSLELLKQETNSGATMRLPNSNMRVQSYAKTVVNTNFNKVDQYYLEVDNCKKTVFNENTEKRQEES